MKTKEKTKHVLLVEDNLLNQKFALAVLKMNGYTADVAENGKVGVEKYEQGEYDVILMDIQMPIMDGIECTKAIRQIEDVKGYERIRIIAVTALISGGIDFGTPSSTDFLPSLSLSFSQFSRTSSASVTLVSP